MRRLLRALTNAKCQSVICPFDAACNPKQSSVRMPRDSLKLGYYPEDTLRPTQYLDGTVCPRCMDEATEADSERCHT
jgi:hypothetical protein